VDDAVDALAAVADNDRIQVVGALVLGAETADEVVAATGIAKRLVLEALVRLEAATIVRRTGDGGWVFEVDRLKEIVKEARPREAPDDVGEVDHDTARVLRTFLRGGRLTQIPLQRQKRLIVLDHVCRVFDIGERYSEGEVNTFLRAFHPDTAALRRYLVDEGFLSRDHSVYWRTGGTVEI